MLAADAKTLFFAELDCPYFYNTLSKNTAMDLGSHSEVGCAPAGRNCVFLKSDV